MERNNHKLGTCINDALRIFIYCMAKILKVALMIERSREYGRGLLRGIADYADKYGPWAFYWCEDLFYRKSDKSKLPMLLKKWQIDGIIMRENEQAEKIIKMGIHTVIAPYTTKKYPGTAKIFVDCNAVGAMGAEYLIDRGYKNLAFCGFTEMQWSQERGEGFAKRAAKSGIETHIYKLPSEKARYTWDAEQTFMIKWLKSLPKPVGIMACNDDRSQQLLEVCKLAALRVPQDVAILGVGNDEMICKFSAPQLSSIARNHEVAGFEAAEILHKLMTGKKTSHKEAVVKPTHVITRQSTDFLAIEDADIIKAVNFISKNADQMIQVQDVLENVGSSRRMLEQKFRTELKRSILDEITRIRTDKIAKMLIESTLSITQIALAMGFSSDAHISRYFSSNKHITPLQYRKMFGQIF
ncbi:MAG: hypothetical protein A2Y12_15635 [Planctomycetes bacterium GWF2_42_9]|nr:MAG: hypothetical protein A2Y12_15635 [Planctomycetes bacterium GWF2_42_9]HAL45080.1 hypothetical protein [Phycisphaerales bacterium]